jgi:hypothetical protein
MENRGAIARKLALAVALGIISGTIAAIITPSAFAALTPEKYVGTATDVCQAIQAQAAEYGTVERTEIAEGSTALEVAEWQEQRHSPDVSGLVSAFRAFPSDYGVTVCVFRGSFVTPTGPPEPGELAKPSHDVLTLLVTQDGNVVFDSAGYSDSIVNRSPDEWSATR